MLIALTILLLLFMLLIGGERGGKSFFTLIENIVMLVICIYFISYGINPVIMTILCSILFIFITIIQQNGTSMKTYASVVSVLIMICILSIVVGILSYHSNIAGYNELDLYEEINMCLDVNIHINLRDLVFTVIIFGSLGAVMDTAISISTSVSEFYHNNKELAFHDLVRSGKSVGQDILGTTVNTVFFAGIGETMMQTILFIKYGYTFETLINSKAFLQEFSLITISNLGCLLIIPIVTIITSFMLTSDCDFMIKIRTHIQKANATQNNQ
jgi:Predicted multitransmembrane protein